MWNLYVNYSSIAVDHTYQYGRHIFSVSYVNNVRHMYTSPCGDILIALSLYEVYVLT